MKSKHKSHPDMKAVLSLSKKEQGVAFRKLRRKGIFEGSRERNSKIWKRKK